MNQKRAFTLRDKGIPRELMTPCGISLAFVPTPNTQHHDIRKYKAIWDTGATGCVISKRVAADLGLKPIGLRHVFTPSTPEAIPVNEYLINIFLPNNVAIPFIRATEGSLNNFDVLIGMDIISKGDFAITHKNGGTTFSFQMPSTHDFDFYQENETETHTPVTKEAKPGRNAPCPCGSGKKYKHCHGKTQ